MSSINAQLRYQIIDQRLRKNSVNHWQDLSEACALAAADWNKNLIAPSKRTIAYDIQRMRSGILGYEAPIAYNKHKGYYYTNKKFSIFKVPLNNINADKVKDALLMLKQLTKNEKLLDIHHTLSVLEDKLNLSIDINQEPSIYLEHSLNEAGQRWLDTVYKHIKNRQTLRIKYEPFDGEPDTHTLSPAFIHEYNNRWYLYGYLHSKEVIINLALDRMADIQPSLTDYFIPPDFNHANWFKHMYGVTRIQDAQVQHIEFEVIPLLSKYLRSKPIHPSQRLVEQTEQKSRFSLDIYITYEIIHRLLSYGPDLIVLEPAELVNIMAEKTARMTGYYNSD
ncbi:MAG: WYL domain-containing protein [Chitinophagales bacterium]|nr:WYL domain-containing protein [Chitinophagales bacterium]